MDRKKLIKKWSKRHDKAALTYQRSKEGSKEEEKALAEMDIAYEKLIDLSNSTMEI